MSKLPQENQSGVFYGRVRGAFYSGHRLHGFTTSLTKPLASLPSTEVAHGGFPRDAVAMKKKFNDLDLWFLTPRGAYNFFLMELVSTSGAKTLLAYRQGVKLEPRLEDLMSSQGGQGGQGTIDAEGYLEKVFRFEIQRKSTDLSYLKVDLIICQENSNARLGRQLANV